MICFIFSNYHKVQAGSLILYSSLLFLVKRLTVYLNSKTFYNSQKWANRIFVDDFDALVEFCNCSRTKFEAIIVYVVVFFLCKIFVELILRFCSRTFLDVFRDFHNSVFLLSGVSCSRSEIKFIGKSNCERMGSKAMVAERLRCQTANVEISSANPCGDVFFAPIKYFYATPPRNARACCLRAFHRTVVGLFLNM